MPKPIKATRLPKKQAVARSPETAPSAPQPIVIATRAYELFLQRGGVHGYDKEDWLTAERELLPGSGARG